MKRDLEADLKLCEAATKGPWELTPLNSEGPFAVRMPYPKGGTFYGIRQIGFEADGRFTVAAREGWPWTIAELKRLRERVNELEVQDPDFVQIDELQKTRVEMKRLKEFWEAYRALEVAEGIAAIAAAVTRFDEAKAALEEGEC